MNKATKPQSKPRYFAVKTFPPLMPDARVLREHIEIPVVVALKQDMQKIAEQAEASFELLPGTLPESALLIYLRIPNEADAEKLRSSGKEVQPLMVMEARANTMEKIKRQFNRAKALHSLDISYDETGTNVIGGKLAQTSMNARSKQMLAIGTLQDVMHALITEP